MWKPILAKTGRPKYSAIADQLEQDIRNGILRPGDQLPTHRELADGIGVNVSTVTRAYREAESRRLIAATVGRGTFIAADACAASDLVPSQGWKTDLMELGLVMPFYSGEESPAEMIHRLIRNRRPDDYMKYSDPAGIPEHRAAGAEWMKRFGFGVGPEQVVVTAGAQHALACCLMSCFQPGERIAVDALTYPGFKTLAGMLGIRLVAIGADQDGMIPEALDTACRRDEIKGIYLMPSVQNPTAIHMPKKRREQLAEMIRRHQLLLIEDDVYAHTGPQQLPALATMVPDNSIFIAGLSKILYAGLRSAYVVAGQPHRDRMIRAILNTIWMAPTLNAAITAECIISGGMEKSIAAKQVLALRRNELAAEKLAGFSFSSLPAGFFIWLALPQGWTGLNFETQCRRRGVNIFSAEKFAVGGIAAPAAVRISLSGAASTDELAAGLDIVAQLLRFPEAGDLPIF